MYNPWQFSYIYRCSGYKTKLKAKVEHKTGSWYDTRLHMYSHMTSDSPAWISKMWHVISIQQSTCQKAGPLRSPQLSLRVSHNQVYPSFVAGAPLALFWPSCLNLVADGPCESCTSQTLAAIWWCLWPALPFQSSHGDSSLTKSSQHNYSRLY